MVLSAYSPESRAVRSFNWWWPAQSSVSAIGLRVIRAAVARVSNFPTRSEIRLNAGDKCFSVNPRGFVLLKFTRRDVR